MAEGQDETVRIGKRCFVGNLAWRTSWQDLKDKFRDCGNVVYANVMRDDDGRSKGWGIVEYETPDEALQAINTLNGADLAGRRILVREDREDRDVKAPGAPSGAPAASRSGRGGRGAGRGAAAAPARGAAAGGRGGRGAGRGAPAVERTGESSGLQVVVRGIPWSYTWKELKDMFADFGGSVERADVVYGEDGRSRGYGTVRFTTTDAAQAAIDKFNESEWEGRTLSVFMDKFA
uniref:RRM domain-containing protein n=1 Tax=Chlamydomonas leiostraca TaxID=1034604 RepID=A0A7S0WHE3_9CHLO|mmetsp:Transcript_13702/g.33736  ORF Transcript_13702/g.33736 Transcript_13702/m.33736 type:complete len:234 (+) Transcript_13702:140-841(+)